MARDTTRAPMGDHCPPFEYATTCNSSLDY